jgi:hypothetical protein
LKPVETRICSDIYDVYNKKVDLTIHKWFATAKKFEIGTRPSKVLKASIPILMRLLRIYNSSDRFINYSLIIDQFIEATNKFVEKEGKAATFVAREKRTAPENAGRRETTEW